MDHSKKCQAKPGCKQLNKVARYNLYTINLIIINYVNFNESFYVMKAIGLFTLTLIITILINGLLLTFLFKQNATGSIVTSLAAGIGAGLAITLVRLISERRNNQIS